MVQVNENVTEKVEDTCQQEGALVYTVPETGHS